MNANKNVNLKRTNWTAANKILKISKENLEKIYNSQNGKFLKQSYTHGLWHGTQWPVFDHFVCDFSRDILNPVCNARNNMQFIDYVNLTYEWIHGKHLNIIKYHNSSMLLTFEKKYVTNSKKILF